MSDIYSNIQTRVGRKIQKTDSGYKTKIKDFCRDRYKQVYDRHFWDDLFRESKVTATSGQSYLILPKGIKDVLYVSDRSEDILVRRHGVQNFQRRYLDTLDTQGTIYNYTDFGYSPVAARMDQASAIRVVSTASGDTTQNITLRGFDSNGEEQTETITLTGVSNADGSQSFTAFDIENPRTGLAMVTLSATATGTVTISQVTGGTTLLRLAPGETSASFKMIRLQNVPNAADTLYVGHKEPLRSLTNDGDVPQWDCDDLIVEGAYADCLNEQRQFARAQAIESKWEKMITARINREERDSEDNDQSSPEILNSCIDTIRTF